MCIGLRARSFVVGFVTLIFDTVRMWYRVFKFLPTLDIVALVSGPGMGCCNWVVEQSAQFRSQCSLVSVSPILIDFPHTLRKNDNGFWIFHKINCFISWCSGYAATHGKQPIKCDNPLDSMENFGIDAMCGTSIHIAIWLNGMLSDWDRIALVGKFKNSIAMDRIFIDTSRESIRWQTVAMKMVKNTFCGRQPHLINGSV